MRQRNFGVNAAVVIPKRVLAFWMFAPVVACLSQEGVPQQKARDARALLPPAAVIQQELSVDFENNGTTETVLLYNSADKSDKDSYETGIRVARYAPGSGWATAFEEPPAKLRTGADWIRIEKLRSANGQQGVLVIDYHSGAGTVTAWHVLAYVRNGIAILEPAALRKKILDAREYADNGYNGVKSTGEFVVEDLTGYSIHEARCCPNRPSLEMKFKFTGNSIKVDSVEELPYGEDVPNLGPHGPLLRVSMNGLWAYGFQLPDGFLVLAGSESPMDMSPSMPSAIVALRKNLLDKRVLADDGDHLVLTGNYKFTSLSVATGVMLARPAKGQIAWKDKNGNSR